MQIDLFDEQCGVANEDLLRVMAYFVSERDHIRTEREAGAPAPWTEDDILRTYRFCNIRRKHDRVSKWLIDNIITPYKDNSYLWFMLCCARWINWPPTIQALIDAGAWPVDGFDADAFGDCIDERVASGEKAWTGAYLITARQVPPGTGKGRWIARSTLAPLLDSDIGAYANYSSPKHRSVEEMMDRFKGQYGWGTFMTGQAVADMTYCNILGSATDLQTFAPIGPGSTRGLNRIFGRRLEQITHQERFNQELIYTKQRVEAILRYPLEDLTLHDWQNCFCEFDKYLRASTGAGRPRSIYKPEIAF